MTSPASSVHVRGDSRGRRGRRPWGPRGEASALAGAWGSDPARGGRTPSLRGESVFSGVSPAMGGTPVSLSSCGVRAARPDPRPRTPGAPCPCAARRVEPAVPRYRGEGRAPFARGPAPAWARSQPRPSDLPMCEREGSGWAGGVGWQRCKSLAFGRLTWHCSWGAPDSLFPPQPRGRQLLSVHPGGGGGRAPDGILYVIPGRSFQATRRVSGRPWQRGMP